MIDKIIEDTYLTLEIEVHQDNPHNIMAKLEELAMAKSYNGKAYSECERLLKQEQLKVLNRHGQLSATELRLRIDLECSELNAQFTTLDRQRAAINTQIETYRTIISFIKQEL